MKNESYELLAEDETDSVEATSKGDEYNEKPDINDVPIDENQVSFLQKFYFHQFSLLEFGSQGRTLLALVLVMSLMRFRISGSLETEDNLLLDSTIRSL